MDGIDKINGIAEKGAKWNFAGNKGRSQVQLGNEKRQEVARRSALQAGRDMNHFANNLGLGLEGACGIALFAAFAFWLRLSLNLLVPVTGFLIICLIWLLMLN